MPFSVLKTMKKTILIIGALLSTGVYAQKPTDIPAGDARLPGGATTVFKRINRDSFSHSSANLRFAQELDFKVGNGIFKKLWVSSPASTKASDGLGPMYNARSCQRCHLKDGRGRPPENDDETAVSMFLRLSIPPQNDEQKALLASGRANVIAEPTYGTQLQHFAVQGLDAEGWMRIAYTEKTVELNGGEKVSLRVPSYRVDSPKYGPLHPQTMLSPRVAPQMIGLGLLELIPEKDLLEGEDIDDKNADGISGKANYVWSPVKNQVTLGRFGWKAGTALIEEQNAGAFRGDVGISSPLENVAWGECSEAQEQCRKAPHGTGPNSEPEASAEMMELLLFYTRNLGVPARRGAGTAAVKQGETLFNDIGCASCHTPKHVTGGSDEPNNQHLAGQTIWPYSDLLLHDMGEGLADNRPEGRADGREWRTAPLWGIGLTKVVSGHTFFLHDGRARNLTEAILWHGGEAQGARDRFQALDASQRSNLLRFVESL